MNPSTTSFLARKRTDHVSGWSHLGQRVHEGLGTLRASDRHLIADRSGSTPTSCVEYVPMYVYAYECVTGVDTGCAIGQNRPA